MTRAVTRRSASNARCMTWHCFVGEMHCRIPAAKPLAVGNDQQPVGSVTTDLQAVDLQREWPQLLRDVLAETQLTAAAIAVHEQVARHLRRAAGPAVDMHTGLELSQRKGQADGHALEQW